MIRGQISTPVDNLKVELADATLRELFKRMYIEAYTHKIM